MKTLGDSALHFELSYFVQQPTVNPLLDLQQAVNFRIIDEFRRSGVEFDYPTQRVMLAASGPQPLVALPASHGYSQTNAKNVSVVLFEPEIPR